MGSQTCVRAAAQQGAATDAANCAVRVSAQRVRLADVDHHALAVEVADREVAGLAHAQAPASDHSQAGRGSTVMKEEWAQILGADYRLSAGHAVR